LSNANVPIVEIWDLTEKPIDMLVGFSHEDVGTAVARHLLEKGYKRFGIVSADDPRGLRRSHSVMNELKKHSTLPVPFEVLPAPATLQAGREGLTRMLKTGLPEVIVCSTDTLAQGILAEAASRGLRVPDDVAVMGFGDLSTAAHVHPALSTVRVDGLAIGKTAAQALLGRFAAGDRVPITQVRADMGFSIIDRASA
jgi:LacI family transcriptional regulator, gluconate utilization system Gnt-I transcriptional repressor